MREKDYEFYSEPLHNIGNKTVSSHRPGTPYSCAHPKPKFINLNSTRVDKKFFWDGR